MVILMARNHQVGVKLEKNVQSFARGEERMVVEVIFDIV
uniref:Uncharacterized protein n=1 Tax=Rhizophora mucronata TaxID=61149 RepID=A0A2P2QQH4_RHIMU